MRFNNDQFKINLKSVINQLGSVAECARILSVSEGTVRSWRDGNSYPQIHHVVNLADAAGVSLSWLAANEGAAREPEGAFNVENRDKYLDALLLCEEVLQSKSIDLPPPKKVELVKIVAGMMEKEDIEDVRGNIYQLVALAS